MKKQIWLHVCNDFKSFLANEIKLTIEQYDWSKRLFKGSTFVHLKKIKFQKNLILINFFFFTFKILISKKKKIQDFFRTTSGPDPLWERYIGNLFKGPVTITQKETSFQKRRFFKKKKKFRTTFGPNPLWGRYVGNLSKGRSQSLKFFFFKGSKSKHFFVWI